MRITRSDQFQQGYVFESGEIRRTLSPTYLKFLNDAEYVDLARTPNLFVAAHLLKVDEKVQKMARENEIDYSGAGEYVARINQDNARRLIRALGGRVLTSAFMFRLVIPELKSAEETSREARKTLSQMRNDFAEYLEDRVLDKNKLVVGSAEEALELPQQDGRFDRVDMNEFGYPTAVKDSGEFYHWHVSGDERAAIRYWDSELDLDLYGEPSFESDWLGVRFAKFF